MSSHTPTTKTRSSAEHQRAGDGDTILELEPIQDGDGPAGAPHHAPSRSLASRGIALVRRATCYPPARSLRLRSTSWLDGARGVAALAVYLFHAMGCWASIVPAWHADANQTSFFQLPLVRSVFVAGGGAVSVFFVLSGYVLTHRCLAMIRVGAGCDVYPAVASSAFRRGFRLYLPPVLLTFCELLMTQAGYAPPLNFTFVPEPTFAAQLWDWLVETNNLVNPLHNFSRAIRGFVSHPKYDPVIWTIPVEFYGSMVCYALLVVLARVSRAGPRMAAVALLAVAGMALGCWNIFCFASGMLLADFTLGQDADALPSASTSTRSRPRPLLWTVIFLVAFYIAGFPTLTFEESRTNPMPGFETLRALIPSGPFMEDRARFWWSISGVVLLLAVSQVPRLKAVFETNVCQYLAKISFSLYLVHEFCIVLFGLKVQSFLMWLAGVDKADPGLLYWVVCWTWFVVFTVPVFALAAQVERWVDVPSVRFAKWLEERCLRVYKGL
ncbi:acyltransferase family-domain-containing protein [Staphylotrichum tortipilum]|uniref:Acyltransferase family-domain-containing protein n=1 Tax=Staphylotrichum tortipilum TaxID=2831512 RepID=A0AAN6MS13_9PEZI|nr:acyltransferase family-domain-containing protein [Staphylotrichum longicolle]